MTDNVDDRYFERWNKKQQERDIGRRPPAGGDGGGSHMPDMELLKARVDGLERTVDRMDGKLDTLDTRMRGVEGDLREIKATLSGMSDLMKTLTSKLPSWWQMLAVMVTVFVLAGAASKLFSHS